MVRGYYVMAADQLEKFRAAVDDDTPGKEVEALVRGLERKGYRAGAMSELKTAPRGYPPPYRVLPPVDAEEEETPSYDRPTAHGRPLPPAAIGPQLYEPPPPPDKRAARRSA